MDTRASMLSLTMLSTKIILSAYVPPTSMWDFQDRLDRGAEQGVQSHDLHVLINHMSVTYPLCRSTPQGEPWKRQS